MLNGYAFQKRLNEFHKIEYKQTKEQKIKQRRSEDRENLAYNYKTRVDKFIHDMSIEPVFIKNHSNKAINFRPKEDRSKMLGDALIRTKSFVTEKERVKQSIEHYKNLLDTEACLQKKVVHDFRERDISKEIQPKMRFTASTQLERVVDTIHQYRNQTQTKQQGLKNKNPSVTNMIIETMQNNLLHSLQNQQNSKLKYNLSEPSLETNGSKINDTSQFKKLTFKDPFNIGKQNQNQMYSTTSSSRLRFMASAFMNQNIMIAREINKHNKKLHFQAAQSVQLQHPGSLQNKTDAQLMNNEINSLNSSPNVTQRTQRKIAEQDTLHSMQGSKGFNRTQESFLDKQKFLSTSKSAFYLPITKNKKQMESNDPFKRAFNKTQQEFGQKSHFQLPSVQNPLLLSKEKQKQMASYLEQRSKNPYEIKSKKTFNQSQQDKMVIDALMRSDVVDSSYYNQNHKNSPQIPGKKLRFAAFSIDKGGDAMQESNSGIEEFQLEPPIMKQIENNKTQQLKATLKKIGTIKKNDESFNQVDSVAYDILQGCNAISKKPQDDYLKKGNGRIMAGDGKTNYQVYSNLLRTF